MKDVVNQTLVFKDWPLTNPGDEKFFGYVVGMGIFPKDWSDDGLILYCDFAYNNDYSRYRLPADHGLIAQLHVMLLSNLEPNGGIYGKVWIKRNNSGYEVFLP